MVIILAKSNQFVSDVSEGMTGLKNKYKTNFPSNITTINVKNKLNDAPEQFKKEETILRKNGKKYWRPNQFNLLHLMDMNTYQPLVKH